MDSSTKVAAGVSGDAVPQARRTRGSSAKKAGKREAEAISEWLEGICSSILERGGRLGGVGGVSQ
eukprot:3970605-Pyramimonas_sp.AAC.1